MTAAELERLEDEIEQSTAVIIAAEKWAKGYDRDPETHAKLIRTEAKLDRILRKYFKELSERHQTFISWARYSQLLREVQASDDFTVEVILEEALDTEDSLLMQVMYDPIETAVFLGASTGETVYARPLGISRTSQLVQKAAKETVAELVGKKVQNGVIVDNPKSKYRISDKTRQDIRESIKTSFSLREDTPTAAQRLQTAIKNPKRAELIAQTETVNAYNAGIYEYGLESGAVAKEWETVGADDICAVNASEGIIPITQAHASGHQRPAAHPRCRCSERLVYPEELEQQ